MKQLMEYMIEDTSTWEKVVNSTNIACHRRPVPNSSSFLIKAVATIEGLNFNEIFDAIYDVNIRMSWDTVFKDFKIVRPCTEDQSEVIYMGIKVNKYMPNNLFS